MAVPAVIPDDNFIKISKGFKHNRFPVVTWKSDTGALLIRGGGFTSQTMVTRLKKANFLGSNDGFGLSGSHRSLNSRDITLPNSIEM